MEQTRVIDGLRGAKSNAKQEGKERFHLTKKRKKKKRNKTIYW
jgi:hypothetical protein